MKFTVWIAVAEVWHSNESRILGVYATEAAARAAWPKPPQWFDEVCVTEYEVLK